MSERLTNILGYLTLFAILGAIWVLFGEDPTLEQGARGERTFAGLSDSVNGVTEIHLAKGDVHTTLVKGAEGWTVSDRSAFPADTAKVKDMLRGMALSDRREPKTANQDRFDRLGLGADALGVTLLDANGLTVAAMDMGTRKAGPAAGRSLTYVYRAGDSRAWLVTALAEAEADPTWWLARPLVNMPESRITTVRLGDATLERAEDGGPFALSKLGDGEAAKPAWALSEPARVIASLDFTDVQRLANPLASELGRVEAVTRDGILLSVALFPLKDEVWAQLSVRAEDGAPEDIVAEASALEARASGWLFRLDGRDAEILGRTRADFITPKAADRTATP